MVHTPAEAHAFPLTQSEPTLQMGQTTGRSQQTAGCAGTPTPSGAHVGRWTGSLRVAVHRGQAPPPTSGRRYDGNITGEETKHRKVKSGPEPKRPRDTRQVKPLGSDDVWLEAGNNQVA